MNACAIQRPIAPHTAIRLLAAGLAAGVLSMAMLPSGGAIGGSAGGPLVALAAVPFLLAGLTGIAKTTTA